MFWERALAITEKALGPEHPDTAVSLSRLAELYNAAGAHVKAEPLFERAQGIVEINAARFLLSGDEARKRTYLQQRRGYAYGDASFSLAVPNPRARALGLRAVLQYKGRVLDAMAGSVALLRRSVDPKDQALIDELAAVAQQLSTLTFRGPGNLSAQAYRERLWTSLPASRIGSYRSSDLDRSGPDVHAACGHRCRGEGAARAAQARCAGGAHRGKCHRGEAAAVQLVSFSAETPPLPLGENPLLRSGLALAGPTRGAPATATMVFSPRPKLRSLICAAPSWWCSRPARPDWGGWKRAKECTGFAARWCSPRRAQLVSLWKVADARRRR
jgi:hypothetical protein